MTTFSKFGMGCGICLAFLGIMVSYTIITRLFTEISQFNIALILCVMGLLATSSFLIIPGFFLAIRGKLSSIIGIVCALVGLSMLFTLGGLAAVTTAAGESGFEEAFYDSLLPLLGLGFFGGLVTTGIGYGYFDTLNAKPDA